MSTTCILFFCGVCSVFGIGEASSQCLRNGNGSGLPEFEDYSYNDAMNRITRHHQVIVHNFKFECCGNITEWGADVFSSATNRQNHYAIDFQVWRPSPTVNDSTGNGQYNLVGNNKFTSISLNSFLARVTPSPPAQDYIQFRPGDVLGFYVESAKSQNDGIVLNTTGEFSNEFVWQASVTPSKATSQTVYSVGMKGVLNTSIKGAPVIYINDQMTFSCPTLPEATTLPIPPPHTTTDSDSNEIPPPTIREPQQPTVPLPTTNSPNDNSGQTQTLPNFKVITTTGVGSGVPTTSEAVSDQQISSSGADVGLIVGIVIVIIALIAVTLIFTVVVIVLKIHQDKKRDLSTSVPTDTKRAYGVTLKNSMDLCTEEDAYSYSNVVLDNTLQTKSNEAYATSITTEGNVAHSTNTVIEENETYCYATNIVTKTNEAYTPRKVVTETIQGHKPLNDSDPEDEHIYDYIGQSM